MMKICCSNCDRKDDRNALKSIPSDDLAEEVWNEACKAQMKEVFDALGPGGTTNDAAIKHWTKTPKMPEKYHSLMLSRVEGLEMTSAQLEPHVDKFMSSFENEFKRGDIYSNGAHGINIAYYFEQAMEHALEYIATPMLAKKEQEIKELKSAIKGLPCSKE